jgi:spartin
LDTFENILQQYVVEYHDTSSSVPPTIAGQSTTVDVKGENKNLRGHLVMINEETGQVVGEVEDRFRIKEDPMMHERGHENDPVIIEVEEQSLRQSDANALEAFARIVPPDQRNWITSSANIVR